MTPSSAAGTSARCSLGAFQVPSGKTSISIS
jgi:hypothetical protein